MGCVVLLLAGILRTIRPEPVLVVLGLTAGYAILIALAAGIGNVGAAIGSLRLPRRVKHVHEPIFTEPAGIVIKIALFGNTLGSELVSAMIEQTVRFI
jgi:hypothetical protein